MTSFKYPVAVEPLLNLVGRRVPGESSSLFATDAHVLALAASYGFYLCRQGKAEFSENPQLTSQDPIKESTMGKQGLMDQLLIIAIAHKGSVEVVRDDSTFASVIQAYAHIGAVNLSELLTRYEGDFLRELADLTRRAVEVHNSNK